jgi:hypothetical protein
VRPNYSGPSGSIPIRVFGSGWAGWKSGTGERSPELEHARRGLERLRPREAEGLGLAWQRYCKVIAELDRATAEFESLRACAR